jgi:SpoVK/Ycf46/Vps4 family AAA+-type ATPase
MKASLLLSKWVGESEGNVLKAFESAKANSPTIMFFDELDGLGNLTFFKLFLSLINFNISDIILICLPTASKRDDENGGSSVKLLNEILDQLNGLREKSGDGVYVIGATNR